MEHSRHSDEALAIWQRWRRAHRQWARDKALTELGALCEPVFERLVHESGHAGRLSPEEAATRRSKAVLEAAQTYREQPQGTPLEAHVIRCIRDALEGSEEPSRAEQDWRELPMQSLLMELMRMGRYERGQWLESCSHEKLRDLIELVRERIGLRCEPVSLGDKDEPLDNLYWLLWRIGRIFARVPSNRSKLQKPGTILMDAPGMSEVRGQSVDLAAPLHAKTARALARALSKRSDSRVSAEWGSDSRVARSLGVDRSAVARYRRHADELPEPVPSEVERGLRLTFTVEDLHRSAQIVKGARGRPKSA